VLFAWRGEINLENQILEEKVEELKKQYEVLRQKIEKIEQTLAQYNERMRDIKGDIEEMKIMSQRFFTLLSDLDKKLAVTDKLVEMEVTRDKPWYLVVKDFLKDKDLSRNLLVIALIVIAFYSIVKEPITIALQHWINK
jgi:predicted nuclease with TOPRIM domain